MSKPTDAPIRLKSGCKINLGLEITGRRADGYHTLRSYFLPLAEPQDILRLSIQPGVQPPACQVLSTAPGLDLRDNTLTKSYRLLAEKVPELPALRVELHKGVPQGAGLGGGSANAAVLLNFLNAWLQKQGKAGLTRPELLDLACRVGADVPFFIIGKPAWASGIGEVIRPNAAPLEVYRNMHLVLACPRLHVPTAWAFKEWDNLQKDSANALTTYVRHDSNNSAEAIRFVNNLENPVFAAFPELKALKEQFLDLGATQALMSGSGSSIFGLFASSAAAVSASKALQAQGLDVFVQALYTGASPSW